MVPFARLNGLFIYDIVSNTFVTSAAQSTTFANFHTFIAHFTHSWAHFTNVQTGINNGTNSHAFLMAQLDSLPTVFLMSQSVSERYWISEMSVAFVVATF
jgi:hypothetical protein